MYIDKEDGEINMKDLSYYVDKNQLYISVTFENINKSVGMYLEEDKLSISFKLVEKKEEGELVTYLFTLSYKEFLDNVYKMNPINNPLKSMILNGDSLKVNVFIKYMDTEGKLLKKILKVNNTTRLDLKNLIELNSLEEQITLFPYITKKGACAVLVNSKPKDSQYFIQKTISKINVKEEKILIKGNVTTKYFPASSGEIQLFERGGYENRSTQINILNQEKLANHKFRTTYKIELQMIDLKSFLENLKKTEELSIDLFLNLLIDGTSSGVRFRVGNPRFLTNLKMKGEMACYSEKANMWLSLVPYITLKGGNVSFIYNQYDSEAYEYFRMNKRKWKQVRKKSNEANIWIVGERSYKAQDNGYHFFKYLREEHPDVDAYYVIKKDSPERENIEHLGNIIEFNSKEHFEKVIQAKYICGTHHPDSLYPIRSKEYIKNVKAKKIFLQHGVFGTKNIAPIYAKWVNEFYTDLFITSSEKEKQIAINDMGYSDKEVVVTGLSRFDELFNGNTAIKRQILIIPTWRDWITNREQFEQSEYLNRYMELLSSERLIDISKKYHVELLFCLHPNMQDYVSYFERLPLKIIRQGEVDVQKLIKESMVMITDYSSVAFDFSFLEKPVIYYQFDQNRFLGKYPSHLDLENDLPGYIAKTQDEVLNELEKIAVNNFAVEEKYNKRSKQFIKYKDTHSSERIYNAILNVGRNKKVAKNNPIVLKVLMRLRRSKFYFPTMKYYYKFYKTFVPIKKNRILFESSLGKRYEDSPKMIYENLVTKCDDMEFIWVMNGSVSFDNKENVKVIKRLSPEYYRYLATSKIWVNNQNFPYYLKKRKGTFYLQTWHGTPLKKMQHDIDVIEGRDSGYIDRVTQAKDQWSALLSPSPYASNAFRTAFQYKGPIYELGYPRNDVFYKKDNQYKIDKIKESLNIPTNKKIILYAPTFRDQIKRGGKFVSANKLHFKIFQRRLGDEYILLVRQHILIADKTNIPEECQNLIFDVSKYPDIQDLMLVSDMLVTDYSSVMFDYLNTNKPIYFYCFDLEEYQNSRGFYFDFLNEAPGPIAKNSSTLFKEIQKSDYWELYGGKYSKMQKKFIPLDGENISEAVSNKMLSDVFKD